MNRVRDLSDLLHQQLSQLIDGDYVLLDIPYYSNIGDTLIYKGTLDLLETLPFDCLYKTSIENYTVPHISDDIIILFQGGGNFGDTWRRHTDFVIRVLKQFPNNKAIILPQTVYYENKMIMENDAVEMGKHADLTVCVRDKSSYSILHDHFTIKKLLLLPDLAFCIKSEFLNNLAKANHEKDLLLKRADREYTDYNFTNYIGKTKAIDEKEWPSMETKLFIESVLEFIKKIDRLCRKLGLGRFSSMLVDTYAQKIYMPQLLQIGVEFISGYKHVYSMRLHGAILSILLDKEVTLFDNSYGKNKDFYDAWLNNFEKVKFIKKWHRD